MDYPGRVNGLIAVAPGLSGWQIVMKMDTMSRQQLPKATLITVNNVAHMVNMEKPDEFNRIVYKWLSGDKAQGRVNEK